MTMESLGTYLKTARELRGVSQAELSVATRLPIARIKAFEEDRLSHQDEGIYLKSLVKSYIEHLGLNEEVVMLELRYHQVKAAWRHNEARRRAGNRTVREYPVILFIATLLTILVLFSYRESGQSAFPDEDGGQTVSDAPEFNRLSQHHLNSIFDDVSGSDIDIAAVRERDPDRTFKIPSRTRIHLVTEEPARINLVYPREGREISELLLPGKRYSYEISSQCILACDYHNRIQLRIDAYETTLPDRSPLLLEFIPVENPTIIKEGD